ncbi:MAG: 3-oxoadipate enol-lactonase [Actinomycetota bacterium]|jgi:pimeloyl-ACP methyl ester carboxylesterase|nr:3-oxoadipate enol-lactonase [Actinomycetota bacterium]
MPLAEINGAKVAFDDTGSGETALVFSHGFLMDRSMFAPQIDALTDAFRCISWDERGHGETESDGPFTYWDSAEDLLELLDHLGIERAFLAGMSQGGFVSLRASILKPDRVAGLILIDTQAGPEEPNAVPLYESLFEDWRTNGPTEPVARSVAQIIIGDGPEAQPWIDKWLARDPRLVSEPFHALVEREDIHDRLSEIHAPAIVIHGSQDAAIPIDKAERLCEGLPNCEGVHVIDGGTHASNVTHPEEATTLIRDFLERNS